MLLLKTKLSFLTYTFEDKTVVKLEEKWCAYGVITHIVSTKKVDLKIDSGQNEKLMKIGRFIYIIHFVTYLQKNLRENSLE